MNPGIEANNENEGEVDENIDVENENDAENDAELDISEDEYFDEIYSEIVEAVNRNAEHLQLLHKSFNNIKLELFDVRSLWYRGFFKEIEIANDTVEQVEEELFEMSD